MFKNQLFAPQSDSRELADSNTEDLIRKTTHKKNKIASLSCGRGLVTRFGDLVAVDYVAFVDTLDT
jgi:hypothetical protein